MGRAESSTPWPSMLSSPWSMAAGALGVSTSAVLIGISGASPGTATFYRCALAAVLLLPLVIYEWRREGAPTNRQRLYAPAAGLLFAGDALWWTQAIGEVGAGLSTVLVNAQVVIVPLLALAVDREPISRRFLAILPVMIIGIVLTGGVLEEGAAAAGRWPAPSTPFWQPRATRDSSSCCGAAEAKAGLCRPTSTWSSVRRWCRWARVSFGTA
jgi:uncharacterized membrane protein